MANLLAAAATAAVVVLTAIGCVAAGETPACACDVEPNLGPAAERTAVRFEELVRSGDVSGAWTLLTDDTQARYADVAGFRPVVERLGAAYADADASGHWLRVADRLGFSGQPSEVVVARYAGSPPRLLSAVVVQLWLDRVGDERVDPEPALVDLRAAGDDPLGLRIDVPGAGPRRAWFVVVDAAGAPSHPNQQSVSAGVYQLSWSAAATPLGPVLAVGAGRNDAGWWIGAATAVVSED